MEPDFSLLYSELDLSPDCSLEDFKCAYRRRISELHPDRAGGDPSLTQARIELPTLIATYVAVNRFHSRYGRMPGASPRTSIVADDVAAGGEHRPMYMTSHANLPIAMPSNAASERSTRPTWRFMVLFFALLVLLASWDWLTLAS